MQVTHIRAQGTEPEMGCPLVQKQPRSTVTTKQGGLDQAGKLSANCNGKAHKEADTSSRHLSPGHSKGVRQPYCLCRGSPWCFTLPTRAIEG